MLSGVALGDLVAPLGPSWAALGALLACLGPLLAALLPLLDSLLGSSWESVDSSRAALGAPFFSLWG